MDAVEQPASTKTVADVDRQIQVLRSHDVRFEECSEQEARTHLSEKTYFFKLKAFDKKFGRNAEGNYAHLDFAYLRDVASIDFLIRRLVLQLTTDVEHALKVRFNSLLMRRTSEDGYTLVSDFEQSQREYYRSRNKGYDLSSSFKKSAYTMAIIEKYGGKPPAWLLWETCSMNEVNAFYRFFLRRAGYRDTVFALLDGVRILRNAAAHNNCLLTAPAYEINRTEVLERCLDELLAGGDGERRHAVVRLASSDPLVHDFACVICSHINLVASNSIADQARSAATRLSERIGEHMDWYRDERNECGYLCAQLDAVRALLEAFASFDRTTGHGVLTAPPRQQKHRRNRHSR